MDFSMMNNMNNMTNMPIPKMAMQMFQLARKGGNPQQIVMNMLQQNSNDNPLLANLMNLAKENKTDEIEKIARSILKEQGRDYDKEFANFKQMFGL